MLTTFVVMVDSGLWSCQNNQTFCRVSKDVNIPVLVSGQSENPARDVSQRVSGYLEVQTLFENMSAGCL